MLHFDHIVVGAGSAGCVLAARLSESGDRKVLLLEAGGSNRNPLLQIPLGVGQVLRSGMHNWNLTAQPSPAINNRCVPYPRGRVMGGTSSINGMIYIRGNAADYDEIAAMGNRSWSYREVLPYFKRAENHQTRHGEFHGNDGPLKVSTGSTVNPLYDAFMEAGIQSGYPVTGDFNGAQQEGFGRYDFTIANGRRQSTAATYLRHASKQSNLTIYTQRMVTRILIEKGRAQGVEFTKGHNIERAYAGEVIICGGTVHSPHLLMLSGIGDPQTLQQAGITVVHQLPGVGKNLRDHLRIQSLYACSRPVTMHQLMRADRLAASMAQAALFRTGPATAYPAEAGAFTKIFPTDDLPEAQWYLFLGTRGNTIRWPWSFGADASQQERFAISTVLLRPESVGEIRPRSSNPADNPLIYPNLLAKSDDLERLISLGQQMQELSARPAFRNLNNGSLSGTDVLKSQSDWREWIRREVVTSLHPVGTCKMGHDTASVVDDQLNVHGINNLRVADASIFPIVPRGNTNAPTIMAAEKASDFILGRTPDTISPLQRSNSKASGAVNAF